MRSVVCIVLAAVVYIFSAAQATAKVYWLPDYLKSNADRSNSHFKPDGTPDTKPELECPAGCMTDAEKGSMVCDYTIPILGVGNCYCDCVEKDICEDVPEISNCGEVGCKTESTTCPGKCEECYESICDNPDKRPEATKITCGGEEICKKYWDDCPNKCEVAYTDCCEPYADKPNVDGGCGYGCNISYEAEGCPTKCKECDDCLRNDCSAFPLSSPPDNALYEECIVGCGDTTPHYKFLGCSPGFYDKESFVCKVDGNTTPQLCTWSLN